MYKSHNIRNIYLYYVSVIYQYIMLQEFSDVVCRDELVPLQLTKTSYTPVDFE